ncbi:tyrosine-type recombinase/integrase [Mesorhizobium temperatum]|uniref:tyrosine-type recombinase/integrase n=1 Tax=Mesorhizobium temperatum TaxID=241416 RepID=UPI001FD9648A|nr:tyrosine-type recombinase/integrase [Mesorhizobium temperatum]
MQRILADAETDEPQDIRDRAILLLLAVYGMRSGEVAALRLDQIDWAVGTLRLFRLKRRQPQIYPLVPSVAEALACYIDTARPPSSCPEVFLCMQAPRRPLKGKTVCPPLTVRWLALHCASEGCSDKPSRSSSQEDEPWQIIGKHLSESMSRN